MSLPRYPAYKDSGVSWLGEVPAHWEIAPIKRAVCSFEQGWSPQCENFAVESASEWGVLKVGCVNGGVFRSAENKKLPDELSPLIQYSLKKGDLLISRANTRELVGSAAVVPRDFDNLLLCDKLYRARTNLGYAFIVYLALFLGTPEARSQIELAATGASSSMLNIGQAAILDLPIPRFEQGEMNAILAFLDRETAKIDALIAEQEKLIALLAEKRQATISRAVTRGLDPNVPLKESGVPWLGKVPTHWKACPLRYLAKVGNGSTPSRDHAAYWAETGFPWLNSSVVNQDEVTESDQFVTDLALKECHLPVVTPPAVLMGITGQGKTRGMVAKLGFVATVNQHLAYIKPNSEMLDDDFLLRVFESAYEYLRTESDGAGSTKGAITCDQVSRLHIPLPEIGEQVQIADYLNQMTQRFDSLKDEALTAVALLKERRAALISAAVTGKIDVRQLQG
ncbi:type I restriction enzyme S subunit [Vogesella perlucida]|nr:type I restriction enzyme S subunit [Vogesella perlucida]